MVTLHCDFVGQEKLRSKSAFEGTAVFIVNPFRTLETEVFKSLQIFWRKKDAIEFCKRWGFVQSHICPIQSRFQYGYAIDIGRGYYAPIHAEARLFAHTMGCEVKSIS
jgi:hypothetical protein